MYHKGDSSENIIYKVNSLSFKLHRESTIGPKLARKIPLTSGEESIYLNNIPENYNKFCFRPTSRGANVFPWACYEESKSLT